jgi:hypothetical protein
LEPETPIVVNPYPYQLSITQIIEQKPNGGDVDGIGSLWEEHVGGVELISKLLGWSGSGRSGKRSLWKKR